MRTMDIFDECNYYVGEMVQAYCTNNITCM